MELRFQLWPGKSGNVVRRWITEAPTWNPLHEIAQTNTSEIVWRRICKSTSPTAYQIEKSHIEEVLGRRISKPTGITLVDFAESRLQNVAPS
jgi:hypothetical protein